LPLLRFRLLALQHGQQVIGQTITLGGLLQVGMVRKNSNKIGWKLTCFRSQCQIVETMVEFGDHDSDPWSKGHLFHANRHAQTPGKVGEVRFGFTLYRPFDALEENTCFRIPMLVNNPRDVAYDDALAIYRAAYWGTA